MKKLSFLSAVLSIGLFACEKHYTCNCSTAYGVYTKDTHLSQSAYSKKKAKAACASKADAGESCYPVYSN